MVNFLFVISELFSPSFTEICQSRRVSKGEWVTLSADFRRKGALSTSHCWCQNSRMIALSCDIKIFTVHHLVLSQSTRVRDRWTDGQNYDSQDRANFEIISVK